MRKPQIWILFALGLLVLFPVVACSANTETAIAQTAFFIDAQTATTTPDALTASQAMVQGEISDVAIIGSTAKNTRDAASWADGFPATTSKTYAGTAELTITNITAEESSWIAQAVAVVPESEGRANATKLDATLTVLDFGDNSNYSGNPLTPTAWEAQGRANAQIPTTITNLDTAADNRTDETAAMATTRTYKNDENSIPMNTANTRDDFAVTAASISDQANMANGRTVGSEETINPKSLHNNPRPEVPYHVIKPNFNGLTRA